MEQPKGTNLGSSLLVPSMVKEHPATVPLKYVGTHQDPPSALLEVPIIDMQRLLSEDKDSADSELERLHIACKDWGFFQMINHGISSSLVETLKEETQKFFKLPMEEKKKLWQEPGDLEGFGQALVDQKLDWFDMFLLTTLPPHIRKPRLFSKLPLPFRLTIEEYATKIKDITLPTLIFIAKASKMEVEDMKVVFDEGIQSMRINYYPPCPQPEQVIGLRPHSDSLGITFLLQVNDVDGLQIKKDGNWITIKPLPNAFIVNVGDVTEIMTNGLYKSVEHRAIVNSQKERLSIGTFVGPKMDGDIGPAPSIITPDTPPRFTRVTMVDFIKNLKSKEVKSKNNVEQYYIGVN